MLEYAAVLSNSSGAWFGNLSYLVDDFRNSLYFWPSIVGAVLFIYFGAKLLSKSPRPSRIGEIQLTPANFPVYARA